MSNVIDIARTWINTPFIPQARIKNVGCDCVGLILAVCEEAGIKSLLTNAPLSMHDDTHYHYYRDSNKLLHKLDDHFPVKWSNTHNNIIEQIPLLIGNIALFHLGFNAYHIAFISEVGQYANNDERYVRIIHSCAKAQIVTEHIICRKWLRRIIKIFSTNT